MTPYDEEQMLRREVLKLPPDSALAKEVRLALSFHGYLCTDDPYRKALIDAVAEALTDPAA
jgi:hypothetical protein